VPTQSTTIYTLGHSTRTFDQLVAILRSFSIRAVADVRLIPRSRRYPHFNDDYLAEQLPAHGIAYLPFKSLGGRRRPRKDSPNTGWRNESFRGYADFMMTVPFERALAELMDAARDRATTTMCAEAVPWRCHRSLISDALLVRGWDVLNVMDEGKANPHKLTKFARLDPAGGTTITYPPEEPELFTDQDRRAH
jgi:uncharacterized protein (DUF488 family)